MRDLGYEPNLVARRSIGKEMGLCVFLPYMSDDAPWEEGGPGVTVVSLRG